MSTVGGDEIKIPLVPPGLGEREQRATRATRPGDRFAPSVERQQGERDRRLDMAKRRLRYHHSFLDDITRGIFPHDLILVGAETGAGKTDLVTTIARANAMKGARVHLFALEAEPDEIERRIKFTLLVETLYKANHPRAGSMDFADWIAGDLEDICGPFEEEVGRTFAERFQTLHTFYRGASFDSDTLRQTLQAIQRETDLALVDHLHYVDAAANESENRSQSETIKTLRSTALEIGKPAIAVGHLRKRDQRAKRLVPHVEDFHGSSDLGKVATHVVLIAPAHEIKPSHWYYSPTFIHVHKDRKVGATRFVALCHFDRRARAYAKHYTLGVLSPDGTEWTPLGLADVPGWAKGHRAIEASR